MQRRTFDELLAKFIAPAPAWAFWSAYAVMVLLFVFCAACSTANNYTLPPYEVQRHELTCDRHTAHLPPGLVCVCKQYGSSWDCNVKRY